MWYFLRQNYWYLLSKTPFNYLLHKVEEVNQTNNAENKIKVSAVLHKDYSKFIIRTEKWTEIGEELCRIMFNLGSLRFQVVK